MEANAGPPEGAGLHRCHQLRRDHALPRVRHRADSVDPDLGPGEKTIDTYPDNNGMDDYAQKVAVAEGQRQDRGLIHTDINKNNFEAKC